MINDEQDALFAQTLIKENFGEAALRQEEPSRQPVVKTSGLY